LDATSWFASESTFPTLSPSKFSVGYSFRTPLPRFTRTDAEEEESSGVRQKSQLNESRLSPSPETVLVINASASGKLQTPKQKVQFTYPDGDQEVREVRKGGDNMTI
jgi:DnaJ family protein C protein 11